MLVLGTSLTVFPAAGLPRLTLQKRGKVIIVNAQPTSLDDYAFARMDDLAGFTDAIVASDLCRTVFFNESKSAFAADRGETPEET